MRVVEGKFGDPVLEPMGAVLLALVMDKFISGIQTGNFVLCIDSDECGDICLTNMDENSELYYFLAKRQAKTLAADKVPFDEDDE